MIKHTSRPWKRSGKDIVSDAHTYGGLVCAVYAGGGDNDEELEANMALFLAAPDLLEACESSLANLDRKASSRAKWTVQDQRCYQLLRIAIDKARGES